MRVSKKSSQITRLLQNVKVFYECFTHKLSIDTSTVKATFTAIINHSINPATACSNMWRKKEVLIWIPCKRYCLTKTFGACNALIHCCRSTQKFLFVSNLSTTVGGMSSWTRERQFGHRYLCHFWTEMAKIWSPGTFFQGVWACQISALYHFYFQSYQTFTENH